MLGRKSGVAARLRALYPSIFSWHCFNHRLELAVNDAVNSVTAINHFKAFMEEIHNVYSQSAKNQRQLSEISNELNLQMLKVGRILSTRWVASSFKTVRAVWDSYSVLHTHFVQVSLDTSRNSVERAKFKGLARYLSSKEFLKNLGLMYDALQELSNLSLQLQARNATLLKANKLIKRTIRILESFKTSEGDRFERSLKAEKEEMFENVILTNNPKLSVINPGQFLQSLIDNLKERLLNEEKEESLLDDLTILDKSTWPTDPDIRFGEKKVKSLCSRFNMDSNTMINAMRDYIENRDIMPPELLPLKFCIEILPPGTAECERLFSQMNIIASDERSRILVKNMSQLLMIHINGPPLTKWQPQPYIQVWKTENHRIATDSKSRRIKNDEDTYENECLWKIL